MTKKINRNRNRRTKKKYTSKKKIKTFSHGGNSDNIEAGVGPSIKAFAAAEANAAAEAKSAAEAKAAAEAKSAAEANAAAEAKSAAEANAAAEAKAAAEADPIIKGDDVKSPSSSSSLQELLANCHNYAQYYRAENDRLANEVFKLRYPNIPSLAHQVRSAGFVPPFESRRLYEQIGKVTALFSRITINDDLIRLLKDGQTLNSFDTAAVDETIPTLVSVGIIDRLEPYTSNEITTNAFFKVDLIPPDDEPLFTGIDPSNGQSIQIKYPAVAFMRCRVGKEDKVKTTLFKPDKKVEEKGKLTLHGIYLVTSSTAFGNLNPGEQTEADSHFLSPDNGPRIIGLLKIEFPEDYENRRKKEETSITRIDGIILKNNLPINGAATEMMFMGPYSEIQKFAAAVTFEQRKIPDEILRQMKEVAAKEATAKTDPKLAIYAATPPQESNEPTSYALSRFHISDRTTEHNVMNALKNVGSFTAAFNMFGTAKGLKVVAKATGSSVGSGGIETIQSLIRGGKRRNMKYTMNNKPKNRNKRNRNTKKYKK